MLVDWLPAFFMMALIFWLSSQSSLPSPSDSLQNLLLKKSGHVIAYASLALLYLRGLRRSPHAFLVAFLLAVLYSATDELHQSTVPRREATFRDVAIDTAAAGTALLVARRLLAAGKGWARRIVVVLTGIAGKP